MTPSKVIFVDDRCTYLFAVGFTIIIQICCWTANDNNAMNEYYSTVLCFREERLLKVKAESTKLSLVVQRQSWQQCRVDNKNAFLKNE